MHVTWQGLRPGSCPHACQHVTWQSSRPGTCIHACVGVVCCSRCGWLLAVSHGGCPFTCSTRLCDTHRTLQAFTSSSHDLPCNHSSSPTTPPTLMPTLSPHLPTVSDLCPSGSGRMSVRRRRSWS